MSGAPSGTLRYLHAESQKSEWSHTCTTITKMEDGKMLVDMEAFHNILSRPKIEGRPVAFICAAGQTSLGKSFLLNFFIRYFREKGWKNPETWIGDDDTFVPKNDIEWKTGGTDPCTQGIVIFDEIFELPLEDGSYLPVMIIDTQGIFDRDTPKIVNKTLLTLSAILSSVLILNVAKTICPRDLEYLKTCIDYAQKSATVDGGQYCLELERLVLLLRDFPEDDYEGEGGVYSFENGRRQLEKVFGSTTVGKEFLKVYEGIEGSFKRRDCFLLPPPGMKAIRRHFTGSNGDLDPVFLDAVKIFVEDLANPSNLEAKRSKSNVFAADDLIDVIGFCNKAFGAGDFNATDLVEANLEFFYCIEYEDAIKRYNEEWQDRRDEDITDLKSLESIERSIRKLALSVYDNATLNGTGATRTSLRNDLVKECDESFKNVKERWENERRKRDTTIMLKTENAVYDYQRRLQEVGAVDRRTFRMNHTRIIADVRKQYEDINREQLEMKVNEVFIRMAEFNDDKYEEECVKRHEERYARLSSLCDQLRLQIGEEWVKETSIKCHRDDRCMKKLNAKIMQKISSDFWKNAPTPDESKYASELEEKIQMFMGDARGSTEQSLWYKVGGGLFAAVQKTTDMLKGASKPYYRWWKGDENTLSRFVDDLMSEVRENGSIVDDKEAFVEKYLTKFYSLCSEILVSQSLRLKEDLTKGYQAACEQNQLYLSIAKSGIENITRSMLLEFEAKFLEKLASSYYEESAMREIYKTTEETITKALSQEESSSVLSVLTSSSETKEYAIKFAKEETERSLTKMLKKNKENKEKRRESTRKTTSSDITEGFLLRFLRRRHNKKLMSGDKK